MPLEERVVAGRNFYARAGKRVLDLALGLPLLAPAVLVIFLLAMATAFSSGWPPFYAARRLGKNGREFRMWKIRTMQPDAEARLAEWRAGDPRLATEYEAQFKLADDPRVTGLGRFLRRSSLDELPQLWNVVKGDMTLVGPRPIVEEELVFYGASQDQLLAQKPGIGGLWQVTGRRTIGYPARADLELDYCSSVSARTDLGLLVRTVIVALRMDGL